MRVVCSAVTEASVVPRRVRFCIAKLPVAHLAVMEAHRSVADRRVVERARIRGIMTVCVCASIVPRVGPGVTASIRARVAPSVYAKVIDARQPFAAIRYAQTRS